VAKNKDKKKKDYDGWERKQIDYVEQLVDHSWYSMDTTIARLVSKACVKYINERHGNPCPYVPFDSVDDEVLNNCVTYTYVVLKELADEYSDGAWDNDDSFPEALAEAMILGYLWD
jgi:uncharacterized protein (DUF427 family)